ncbi:MAG: hypothetical protein HN368_03355, partial [Spirochaetales bacterium]|nr:hypothetical protein [Spirochaetales bacterium]
DRDFYKISADYIHFIRETINEREGAETHFTLGSAGDVVPMNRAGRSRENIGSILAGSALLGDRAYRSSDSPVTMETQTIEVDVVTGIGLPEMDDQMFEELQNRLAADDQLDQEAFQEELHRRFSTKIYPGGNFTIPIQFIRIDETIIVALPFEVFSELSITMKSKYPGTVLVSCANGYQGYLPFEHEIARGGYEVQNRSMHFTPGTAEKVQQAIMSHLESFAK